jgi:RNA polymerase sigma factor (sigma-70 family)
MQELDDISLLRQYVERNSEEAFAELITRHINKVYSVALRHTRNPSQAEEITQAVFVILAQKAAKLSPRVILSGWLYETARLTSVTFLRSEIRRGRREQEALMETLAPEHEPAGWRQIAPLLDAAMSELNEADRHAIVLRYFDGKSLRDVGSVMGTSEDAAKKRVTRAVEKLQNYFSKHGIDSTADAITSSISANAVQAAPAMLAKAVVAVALGKGATVASSTSTLIKTVMKTMTWTKLKIAALTGAGLLIAAGSVTAVLDTQTGGAAGAGGGPALMKLQWAVGKKYSMHVDFHQLTETPLPGRPTPTKSDVHFTLSYDMAALKNLDDGGQQLELTIGSQSLNVVNDGQSVMSFDSAQGDNGYENPPKAMLGAKIQYLTDASGNITQISGVDDLVRRFSGGGKSELGAIYGQIFNGDTLKVYASFDGSLPNRTFHVGQTWQMSKEVPGVNVGPIKLNANYTFKNWGEWGGHPCAHVQAFGNFSTEAPSAESGALINIKDGKFTGDFWFDPALGIIVNTSSEQTMTAKAVTPQGTFSPKITRRSELTLVDVQ